MALTPDAQANFYSRASEVILEAMREGDLVIEGSAFNASHNEYFAALINKVGLTLLKDVGAGLNPLAFARRTDMPLGAYIESIFVDMADPQDFPILANGGTVDPFLIKKPLVKAYYLPNKTYKQFMVTNHVTRVRSAFTSSQKLAELLASTLSGLETGAETFDFEQMKEVLARYIGDVAADTSLTQNVTEITDDLSAISFISAVKTTAKDMLYVNSKYNFGGVRRAVPNSRLKLLIRADVRANIEINLSRVYNLAPLNFEVDLIEINNWGGIFAAKTADAAAPDLYPIFEPADGSHRRNADGSFQWTETEGSTTAYNGDVFYIDPYENVLAMLVEDDFLVLAEQEREMDNVWNPRGRYTNTILTQTGVYGYIPFSNAVVFRVPPAPVPVEP